MGLAYRASRACKGIRGAHAPGAGGGEPHGSHAGAAGSHTGTQHGIFRQTLYVTQYFSSEQVVCGTW
jgi:hypothetical protein